MTPVSNFTVNSIIYSLPSRHFKGLNSFIEENIWSLKRLFSSLFAFRSRNSLPLSYICTYIPLHICRAGWVHSKSCPFFIWEIKKWLKTTFLIVKVHVLSFFFIIGKLCQISLVGCRTFVLSEQTHMLCCCLKKIESKRNIDFLNW